MTKLLLRFFFDYGAGGCLWAGDDATREQLGYGPVDATHFDLRGQISRAPSVSLSDAAHTKIEALDFQHSGYLNPKHPIEPCLWTQALCERFNSGVDQLLLFLQEELGSQYEILDQQIRYNEDPALAEYLTANPELSAIEAVSSPSVY
jgi:hypothetical protein